MTEREQHKLWRKTGLDSNPSWATSHMGDLGSFFIVEQQYSQLYTLGRT